MANQHKPDIRVVSEDEVKTRPVNVDSYIKIKKFNRWATLFTFPFFVFGLIVAIILRPDIMVIILGVVTILWVALILPEVLKN